VPPEKLPRPSIFRQQQSFENQTNLFDLLDTQSLSVSYGIVLHKKNGSNGNAYPQIALGIPDSQYYEWLDYRLVEDILSSASELEVTKEDNEYLKHLQSEISKKIAIELERAHS
jgi:hypothetical protein